MIIRDLGYSSLRMLDEIDKKGAYYLNRLKTDVSIFELINNKYQLLDLRKLELSMRKNGIETKEKQVFIGKNKYVPTRMILILVPDDKIEECIKKKKRKSERRGNKTNEAQMQKLGLNVFVTNANKELLPTAHVMLLYKIRWQIELIFKAWKSISQLHEFKKAKPERIETLLYIKILWVFINMELVHSVSAIIFNKNQQKLSVYKAFKLIKRYTEELRKTIHNKLALIRLLVEIFEKMTKKAITEKRKNRSNSIDTILVFN